MRLDPQLPTIILGAGGHARVLVSVLRQLGANLAGCTALEEPPEEGWPEDVAYLGGDEVLERITPESHVLVNGIGSSGYTDVRAEIFESAVARGFRFRGVIHPAAVIAAEAYIDATALIMAGAIVQPGAWIGPNVLINTGAIVDHDCRVGAHSHVATGARLAGGVLVGESVHVGAGATLIQQQEVGAGAVVAAGAVVIRPIAPGAVEGGVPAKPLRSRSN